MDLPRSHPCSYAISGLGSQAGSATATSAARFYGLASVVLFGTQLAGRDSAQALYTYLIVSYNITGIWLLVNSERRNFGLFRLGYC